MNHSVVQYLSKTSVFHKAEGSFCFDTLIITDRAIHAFKKYMSIFLRRSVVGAGDIKIKRHWSCQSLYIDQKNVYIWPQDPCDPVMII